MNACVFTWKEVVDAHTVLLLSMNSERQTMEVHSVQLSVASYVQKVPPDRLVLGNQQTRKSLCHITIYC